MRYILYSTNNNDILKEGVLADLAKYFLQLESSHFLQLCVLDRETQQLIRWDLFMCPTWYYPLGESCQLLVDWLQSIAIAT